MTVYLHDGSYGGHATWTEDALNAGVAAGAIMSPFFTPLRPRPRQTSAEDFAQRVLDANGEVILDVTTHALSLPGVDNWANYRTWSLWSGARGDLSTPALIADHVEAAFTYQRELGSPSLTPTLTLEGPIGPSADLALELAEEGRRQDPAAWQSLSGRRGFWLSPDLDAYVGSLIALRAPTWFLTVVRDTSDFPPDLSDVLQTAAICRTVQSLARRSRVVVCQADLFGLPGIAAGADTVGTGWHTKQRLCCADTYRQNDPSQVRRQAEWHTYEGLAARLHVSQSDVLQRSDRPRADALYRGPVSSATADLRRHHLGAIGGLVDAIDDVGSVTADRVRALRDIYEFASSELTDLGTRYGRVFAQTRATHVDGPLAGLRLYATAEGIWT